MVNLNLCVNTKNGSRTYCFQLNIWVLQLIRWVGFITRVTIKTRSKYKSAYLRLDEPTIAYIRARLEVSESAIWLEPGAYHISCRVSLTPQRSPALFIENIPLSTKRAAVACVETCQVMFYFVYGTISLHPFVNYTLSTSFPDIIFPKQVLQLVVSIDHFSIIQYFIYQLFSGLSDCLCNIHTVVSTHIPSFNNNRIDSA